MKSPITYYGGKTNMLPNILPIIPEHEVYTEVFFGGGAVYWAKKKCKNETINDKLDIVVNFYEQLKINFKKLNVLIQASCFSRTQHTRALFMIRNKQMFDKLQLAWAFWMCSNFSYGCKIGGGIKFSNDQSILPPRVMKNYKREFTEVLVNRIEECHIENNDALKVLQSRNVSKAFHYIDPPYAGADQGHYAGYKWEEYEQLLNMCEKLKGNFILSNYNSPMLDAYVEKNGWWKSDFGYNNKGMRKDDMKKTEVLVANFIPVGKQEFNFSI